MIKALVTSLAAACLLTLSACGGGTNTTQSTSPTPASGAVALSAATYTVAQNAGSLSVSVSRANGSSGAISVAYATTNGTATAGTDYTAASGTLNWTDGDTAAKTFSVPISNATPFSGSRTFSLALSNATGGASLDSPSSAAVTINGSGVVVTPGTLALSSSTYTVSQSSGVLLVSVGRSGGTSGAVTVNYATANGTAVAGTDYTATSGTLNWAAGDSAAKTISVPISNATPYSGGKTFSIALSSPGGGATLGSPSTATATINGSFVPPPGAIALSATTYTVAQSAGSLVVSVTRSGGSSGSVTVNYATSNGSAVAGTDYTATAGILNWGAGDAATKTFSVPISNATPYTGSKTFSITLSNVTGGASLGSPNSATATINGSSVGTPGTLALSASTYAVPQSGGVLIVSVTRSGGSAGAVGIGYATANGTATAGTDYTSTSGTLSWATGDTATKTFSVPISNATPFNGSRTFGLTLSTPTGSATLGTPSTATASITGSGTPGTVALSAASYTVAQTAGSVSISVNRTGGSTGAISVAYATSNGTATAGTDYTAASGTLNWATGDSAAKSFTVAISNATPYNGNRSFNVTISNAGGGASLGTPNLASVTVSGSAPALPIGTAAAARLLTQGTFGATISTISSTANQTYDQWFSAQASATPSLTLTNVVNHNSQVPWVPYWWQNVIQGPDQLRQRTAWALSQIFVTSGMNAENSAYYYDLLVRNAFSNYRTLLENVTLSVEMGTYLSMFRNDKANPTLGTHADQNYAREIMQLFSVGLVQLNLDGTPRLDSNGKTIPTYGYPDIEGMANTLTGWASAPQNSTGEQAWQFDMDYLHPMVSYDAHHETAAKTIIGGVYIPPGGTAVADLKVALDTLYNHPNVGPFLATRLIQRMVTSNPSPAYVSRVASTFNNNGSGVRGDMLAVVRAVLTDQEAVTPGGNTYGKLREPLLKLSQLWRAFNAADSSGGDNEYQIVNNALAYTGEGPLQAPTVFNFYQFDYQRAGPLQAAGLEVPEFQILNENSLVLTANQFQGQAYQFTDSSGQTHQGYQGYDETTGTVNLRTAAWEQYADNPAALVEQLNQVFMLGSMSASMRATLTDYVSAVPTTDTSYRGRRVVETTDLLINSPQYAIQR